ncbi:hypothetical protein F4780DRAFT_421251 [Xylariomycetidae sp. FL0641]|nr:hypothetical protein F4780DRAFT_421251 [Xylariomycetidae sp. FL0641]
MILAGDLILRLPLLQHLRSRAHMSSAYLTFRKILHVELGWRNIRIPILSCALQPVVGFTRRNFCGCRLQETAGQSPDTSRGVSLSAVPRRRRKCSCSFFGVSPIRTYTLAQGWWLTDWSNLILLALVLLPRSSQDPRMSSPASPSSPPDHDPFQNSLYVTSCCSLLLRSWQSLGRSNNGMTERNAAGPKPNRPPGKRSARAC